MIQIYITLIELKVLSHLMPKLWPLLSILQCQLVNLLEQFVKAHRIHLCQYSSQPVPFKFEIVGANSAPLIPLINDSESSSVSYFATDYYYVIAELRSGVV